MPSCRCNLLGKKTTQSSMGMGKPRAAAAAAAVGELVSICSWVAVAAEGQPHLLHTSKNRDMDGALALGGHHLVATHNNQLGVGGHSGSDVGEAAHGD